MSSALDMLNICEVCPRRCKVNRLKGELGYCRSGSLIKLARVSLHEYEEPCISGTRGSGTVFFSNCNLSCEFCQNHLISQGDIGKEISIDRLSEIFLELQQKGAHNINLVTPTHYALQIIEAIKLSKSKGLSLPVLYNTNGYENTETIQALKGYIDVYLPDLKYFNNKYSEKYSNAPKYFMYASHAIKEMVSQVGPVILGEDGLIKRGVIVRHLMIPGLLFDSKKIMDYLHSTFSDDIYISLMNQYTPMHNASKFKELSKPLKEEHYEALIEYCLSIGIKNAYIQDKGTAKEDFVPEFDLRGI